MKRRMSQKKDSVRSAYRYWKKILVVATTELLSNRYVNYH